MGRQHPRVAKVAARFAFVALVASAVGALLACGETRSPLGEECLRSDDCLSGVCAARTCVAAPRQIVGTGGPAPDESARIPAAPVTTDAGADAAADARADAPSEGG